MAIYALSSIGSRCRCHLFDPIPNYPNSLEKKKKLFLTCVFNILSKDIYFDISIHIFIYTNLKKYT